MNQSQIEIAEQLTKYQLWSTLFEDYGFSFYGNPKDAYFFKRCKSCGANSFTIRFDISRLEWVCSGGKCSKQGNDWIALIQHLYSGGGPRKTSMRIIADVKSLIEKHEKQLELKRASGAERMKQYGCYEIESRTVLPKKGKKPVSPRPSKKVKPVRSK